jgi:type III secretion system FlhB-like substrate exporter
VGKAFSKVKKLDNEKDINAAKKCFQKLDKIGLFDSYPNEWYELVCDIQKFIK